eukprot:CAMPEP_0184702712 /NCGR_PEP_ID=MMETSP0313-20130426/25245_1 /TAXON_ID=2792 /ORGANISM="Porphyridium aerugineum, Strain SAG 1380-2" /LENGTH=226 /DNA_ID=CAMNT_0027163275 /DNA_START=120 /DNA_END=800 /DNA_ORIENTATION=-
MGAESEPKSREQEILDILQSRRYDPNALAELETYITEQVQGGLDKYDLDANMAVLKLYQFYPERRKIQVVVQIMAKAMMALPETDFLCGSYMIAPELQAQEPLASMMELVGLLETGMYEQFWAKCDNSSSLETVRKSVVGFDDGVRKFVMGVVGRTYASIQVDLLAKFVNLDEGKTRELINKYGWAIDSSNKARVEVPKNSENGPKAVRTGEHLTFKQIANSRAIF